MDGLAQQVKKLPEQKMGSKPYYNGTILQELTITTVIIIFFYFCFLPIYFYIPNSGFYKYVPHPPQNVNKNW
jgi:riboflavin transporter FmnP